MPNGDKDKLAEQLRDAITITIQFGEPGPRQKLGVALGASDMGGDKMTKSEANYRRHTKVSGTDDVDDAPRECGNCYHYSQSNKCELVTGNILPNFICDSWESDAHEELKDHVEDSVEVGEDGA